MKRIFILTLAVVFLIQLNMTNAIAEEITLAAVKIDGKWGFVDTTGEMVIQAQFDDVKQKIGRAKMYGDDETFSEGFAAVKINTKWGFIDRTGKFMIEPQFNDIIPFHAGVAGVQIDNKQWGYINKTGQFIVQPQLDYRIGGVTEKAIRENVLLVKSGNKYGYIDDIGNFAQFEDELHLHEGLAEVKINDSEDYFGDKDGYIDKNDQILVRVAGKYVSIDKTRNFGTEKMTPWTYDLCEGLAAVRVNGKYGFTDKTGKILIPAIFEEVRHFQEGLAAAKANGQWGYIDKTGKFVVPPQFDDYPAFFFEGLAKINFHGKYGYIDKTGKFTIQPQFEIDDIFESSLGGFRQGLAIVNINGKYGVIDKTGKIVIQPRFHRKFHFHEGIAKVDVGDKWGYIDETGKFIVQPQFNGVSRDFKEGVAVVNDSVDSFMKSDGAYGIIDKNGTVIMLPQFDHISDFSNGLAAVRVKNKYGFIDKTGKMLIPPQYDRVLDFN